MTETVTQRDSDESAWCKREDQAVLVSDYMDDVRSRVDAWGRMVSAAQYEHDVLHWLKSTGFETILQQFSALCVEVGRLEGMGGDRWQSSLDELLDEISETFSVMALEQSPFLRRGV